jgi:hypothetical protein
MTLFAVSIPMVLYHIYGYAIPIVILAALYGFRWKVGMWGNCVTLGVALLSALIAIGWWEDVASLLAQQVPAMLFIVDCVAFWTLFIVSLLILDTATRFMSSVKVKYSDIGICTVENVGNGVALFLLFLVLFGVHSFASGHMGMVGEHPDVAVSENAMMKMTISLLNGLSTGNLSGFSQVNEFDAGGTLRDKHLQRRQALMSNALSKEGPWQQMQYDGEVPSRKGSD